MLDRELVAFLSQSQLSWIPLILESVCTQFQAPTIDVTHIYIYREPTIGSKLLSIVYLSIELIPKLIIYLRDAESGVIRDAKSGVIRDDEPDIINDNPLGGAIK